MARFVMMSIFLFNILLVGLLISPSAKSASPGYCLLSSKDLTEQIIDVARSILKEPFGTCVPFSIQDKNYQGCVEYHWNLTRGKHKGVTVYTQCSQ
jgi:hypothetical protein